MGQFGARAQSGRLAAWAVALAFALLLPLLPSPAAPAARAQHGGILLPFEAGAEWFVSQGYNTSPDEGWSHYNCDPRTGKDEISQSSRCDDGWQYKYSFDLRRVDGEEAGQPVLSPASGVVRWVDPAYGGLSIDLGDGYAVAFYHVDLARGIAAGDELRAGQRVGHVSGPGGGGNGGTPHIHLTVWKTEDGGNWSRIAVPFDGGHPLEGRAFPALPERERNQHLNAVLASSNAPAAPAATPEAPVPVAPADGVTVERRSDLDAFVWEPVLDAAEYQVVLDGGDRTGPWVARTRWDPGDLPAGTYSWQVKARNDAGESPLSPAWTLTIGDDTAPTPGANAEATPVDLAQAVGPTTLNLAAARATVGTLLTTNGSGFAPGEEIRLFWDGATGPLVAKATANEGGAFTVSVPIPAAPAGDHPVVAQGRASRVEAEGSVEVIPSIVAEPAVAPPGNEVEVTLRGFGDDESLDLSRSGEGDPALGSAETDANGSATFTFPAPEEEAGLYDLIGVGAETGVRALGAFRLDGEGETAPETAGEGRMTAPGTFRVTSTVLGLIGGTTSSGEIIDAEDRLVALPACTNTSCPWLEPGVDDELFGTRIECGDECFVRVANPETGACAVAPVLETGPWFTLDDWWNPTAERALNRLPGATSRLAQGYPAAEAAQDGLDVGYGRSPDGVGISNKGYVVGNRAALDLSNRTWQDIGLDLAVGIAEVEATMLWLSGEDPDQAARVCGGAIDQSQEATPAASPEPATPVADDDGSGRDRADRTEKPRASGDARSDASANPAPAPREDERVRSERGADAAADVTAEAARRGNGKVGSAARLDSDERRAAETNNADVPLVDDAAPSTATDESSAAADGVGLPMTDQGAPTTANGGRSDGPPGGASAGRDGGSATSAESVAGEANGAAPSDRSEDASPSNRTDGAAPSDDRAQDLRGFRPAEQAAVEREQQTVGEEAAVEPASDADSASIDDDATGGVGLDAGTSTVGDGGASGQHDGPPLPPRLVAKLPRPDARPPTVGGIVPPPPVPAAPNLDGLITGAIPTPTELEPTPPEKRKRAEEIPPTGSDTSEGDPEPTADDRPDADADPRDPDGPSGAADAGSADGMAPSEAGGSPGTGGETETPDAQAPGGASESGGTPETAEAPEAGEASLVEPSEVETNAGSESGGDDDLGEATNPAPDVDPASELVPSGGPSTAAGPIREDDGEQERNNRDDRGADRRSGDDGRDDDELGGSGDVRGGEVRGGDGSGADRRRNDDGANPEAAPTAVTEEAPLAASVAPVPATSESVEQEPLGEQAGGQSTEPIDPAGQESTEPTDTESPTSDEPTTADLGRADATSPAETGLVGPGASSDPAPNEPAPSEGVGPAEPAAAPIEPPPASPDPVGSPAPTDEPPISTGTPPAATVAPTSAEETPIEATPESTPPPLTAPVEATPEPTPLPDAPAPVETRVFLPASDTSVWTSDPAREQEPMQASVLPVGGPDGAVAYLTFKVEGLAPGSLVSARLVLVGAIGFGGPLSVGALPGVWIDEAGLTSGAAPGGDWPSVDATGAQAAATPIWPGSEAVFDVSGTVATDGVVTFVVRGTPDAGQALGSRESAIPARLEVEAGWAS